MRLIVLPVLLTCFTACVGEVGSSRKPPSSGSADPSTDSCSKLEHDVVIRATADMAALPRTGCYDIYGKLTLQGASITSLADLRELNSVNELDLDHTGLTTIDTKRQVGIYGQLVVIGNTKLTGLPQLAFETAATGIVIDSNPALATLDALGLDDPKLTEVTGDLAITDNPALTAVPLKHLTKVTGATTITGNGVLKTIDTSGLGNPGHLEIADNPQLTAFTGVPAASINGDLAIRNNAQLGSLGAMTALYRVTGNLTIDNNPALVNLASFTTSVKFVDQSLTVTNNANLVDLGALKHVQLIGSIAITNNKSLPTCRASEIDKCTQHPIASVISGNKNQDCSANCN